VEHDHQPRDDGSVFNGRVDKLDFDKPLSEVDYDDIPNDAAEMADQGKKKLRHHEADGRAPHVLLKN
jgi:hypothetical protein